MADQSGTPDFDSMTPEEMMAWMETLAKRQGADAESLTTSADMQIEEVDPDTVDTSQLGEYIPYGWTKEKWEEHLAKEAARKGQAPAAAPPPAAAPAPMPEPEPMPEPPAAVEAPPPAPVAEPAAASAAAPDFDSMTPEEMMAWMETLAKRQGADAETLLTAADMQVQEVDPDTVDASQLGEYIPYGWTKEKWEEHLAKEAARKGQAPAAAPAPPPAPELEPELELELAPELPVLEDEDESMFASTVVASTTPEVPDAVDDAMSWLEDLAADTADALPDLSALGEEADALASLAAEDEGGDPMSWLESLAEGEGAAFDLGELDISAPDDTIPALDEVEALPAEDDSSIEWLESLAKRQGADEDELITGAGMRVPLPDDVAEDGPGYTDYSFETPEDLIGEVDEEEALLSLEVESEELELEDPEAWLDSLASGSGVPAARRAAEADEEEEEEEVEDEDVIAALNRGEAVDPSSIAAFFERQFDKAERIADEEEEEEDFDVEAPAVPTELPDWLLEQMGGQADEDEETETAEELDLSALEAALETPEPAVEAAMPDWLEEPDAEPLSSDVKADILVAETPSALDDELAALEIDTDDPWVEAFQIESQMDPEETPEWYRERLASMGVDAPEAKPVAPMMSPVPPAAPPPTPAPAAAVQTSELPEETELSAGELEPLPDWLSDAAAAAPPPTAAAAPPPTPAPVPAPAPAPVAAAAEEDLPDWLSEDLEEEVAAEDLPDWLADADVEPQEIPDWLLDTLDDEEQATVRTEERSPTAPVLTQAVTPPPPPSPPPSRPAPAPVPASPAPVPVSAAVDVPAALRKAQELVSSGDLTTGLQEYESVVRANTALEEVTGALGKLLEHQMHKHNPTVYRVMGDALMRQGRLQEALDTYRRALNLL